MQVHDSFVEVTYVPATDNLKVKTEAENRRQLRPEGFTIALINRRDLDYITYVAKSCVLFHKVHGQEGLQKIGIPDVPKQTVAHAVSAKRRDPPIVFGAALWPQLHSIIHSSVAEAAPVPSCLPTWGAARSSCSLKLAGWVFQPGKKSLKPGAGLLEVSADLPSSRSARCPPRRGAPGARLPPAARKLQVKKSNVCFSWREYFPRHSGKR